MRNHFLIFMLLVVIWIGYMHYDYFFPTVTFQFIELEMLEPIAWKIPYKNWKSDEKCIISHWAVVIYAALDNDDVFDCTSLYSSVTIILRTQQDQYFTVKWNIRRTALCGMPFWGNIDYWTSSTLMIPGSYMTYPLLLDNFTYASFIDERVYSTHIQNWESLDARQRMTAKNKYNNSFPECEPNIRLKK